MTVPRLGFVGVGWIGRTRMAAALKSGVAEAAAVLDASPAAVAEARRLAPDAATPATFEELLELDLDGVVVATPNAFHAPQAEAAFERGLAVYCQKPLARDGAEARRVVEAAERADRQLGVDLCYRQTEAMRRIRARLEEGVIGDVYAAELAFHNAYGPDKPWFYDRALSGGGCMLDLGIHLVDLPLWLLGWPRVDDVTSRLFAKGKPHDPLGPDVEDYAVARLDLASGATLHVACSWRVSAGQDALISATFHGTEGSLRMENVGGSFLDFRADHLHGTRRTTLAEPPDDWAGRALADWIAAVARGEGFHPDAWRHADVMDVLDRVYAR